MTCSYEGRSPRPVTVAKIVWPAASHEVLALAADVDQLDGLGVCCQDQLRWRGGSCSCCSAPHRPAVGVIRMIADRVDRRAAPAAGGALVAAAGRRAELGDELRASSRRTAARRGRAAGRAAFATPPPAPSPCVICAVLRTPRMRRRMSRRLAIGCLQQRSPSVLNASIAVA